MTVSIVRRSATTLMLLLAAVAFTSRTAHAQTATQTVTFAVNAINQIAFVGAPSLTVATAVAGSEPTAVTNATASWAVTTNQSAAKITASLAANVPTGLTLAVQLAAPVGATSAGYQDLSTVSTDLVSNLSKQAAAGLAVTYRLQATAAAGVVASGSRVVTYTITGGV